MRSSPVEADPRFSRPAHVDWGRLLKANGPTMIMKAFIPLEYGSG